jgi:hypothetical protein
MNHQVELVSSRKIHFGLEGTDDWIRYTLRSLCQIFGDNMEDAMRCGIVSTQVWACQNSHKRSRVLDELVRYSADNILPNLLMKGTFFQSHGSYLIRGKYKPIVSPSCIDLGKAGIAPIGTKKYKSTVLTKRLNQSGLSIYGITTTPRRFS